MEILVAIELIVAAVFVSGSWCKKPDTIMSRRCCQRLLDPHEDQENEDARNHPRDSQLGNTRNSVISLEDLRL